MRERVQDHDLVDGPERIELIERGVAVYKGDVFLSCRRTLGDAMMNQRASDLGCLQPSVSKFGVDDLYPEVLFERTYAFTDYAFSCQRRRDTGEFFG